MSVMSSGASPVLLLEWWKPVVGFESRYEVSNLGSIRRLKDFRQKKPAKNQGGYRLVILHGGGGAYSSQTVHGIVYRAFCGVIPYGLEINHKYGNKDDNRLSRLELMTRSENIRHALALGLMTRGAGRVKVTSDQIKAIRHLHESGITGAELARRYGITSTAVSRILKRKRWAHLI